MEIIFGVLCGIFVGLASAVYMCLPPIQERDNLISEQKEENLQVCNENKEVRAENEELRFDLSVANRKLEQKDEIVDKIIKQAERNTYNNEKTKLSIIKELVKEYQAIN